MYRVMHMKVSYGESSILTHGPYRWFIQAWVMAMWVCGAYDEVIIQRKMQ